MQSEYSRTRGMCEMTFCGHIVALPSASSAYVRMPLYIFTTPGVVSFAR